MMASPGGPDRPALELELKADLEPAPEPALGVGLNRDPEEGRVELRRTTPGRADPWESVTTTRSCPVACARADMEGSCLGETRAERDGSADDDVEELSRQVDRLADGAPLEVSRDPGVFPGTRQSLGLRDRGGDEETGAQPAIHLNGNLHLFLLEPARGGGRPCLAHGAPLPPEAGPELLRDVRREWLQKQRQGQARFLKIG